MRSAVVSSSSLKAFQNKSQVGSFCMDAMFLNVVKRAKFKIKFIVLNLNRCCL